MRTPVIFRRSRPPRPSRFVDALWRRLPSLEGRDVRVRFLPRLTADSRNLYSDKRRGQPVYAGSFMRTRRIVLDAELCDRPRELARILVHEIFHFVWLRLGNQARAGYEEVIGRELRLRARGELGWSAESRKRAFTAAGAGPLNRRKWRDYLCESFCDTAAWYYSGVGDHAEFTLSKRHRDRRARWFREAFGGRAVPL